MVIFLIEIVGFWGCFVCVFVSVILFVGIVFEFFGCGGGSGGGVMIGVFLV